MTVNQRISQSIKILLILQIVIFQSAEIRAQQIIRDRDGGDVIDRVIVIPESDFNIPNLERMASALISQKKSKTKLLLLRVFVSERPALQYLVGKGSSGAGYKDWWEMYKLWKGAKYPVAETLAFGNSATMRYRDTKGFVGRDVLQGEDTFEFHVGNNEFKIVYIGTNDVPPVHIDGPHGPLRVTFSIQTNAPLSEQLGERVLSYLSGKISLLDMDISLRNDAWFIDQNDFPVLSPFFSLSTPPNEDIYSETVIIRCSIWGGKKLGCNSHGGKK